MSDDQSFAHTSAAAYKAVQTPAFDRVAREGVMFRNGFAKRPAEELFDITKDPACLNNLAADPAFEKTKQELSLRMTTCLTETGDPQAQGNGAIWETYPRHSNIRTFPPPPSQ